MVWIKSFLPSISLVYRRQKKQFWECPVWWLRHGGHLLTHHTWDGPRHRHTSSATMRQWPGYAELCSCKMWPSINMFYQVLINTHTGDTGDPHPRYVTHTSHPVNNIFWDQGHWELWSVHQTCIRPQSDHNQPTFSRLLIWGSWTKNFLWGDNMRR